MITDQPGQIFREEDDTVPSPELQAEIEEAPTPDTKDESSRRGVMRFLSILGPGFITGASDDDPSGIGTYASVGASLGFAPLWTALLTLPLATGVQYICAKIGIVTGKGLAGVLRQHYPRWLLYISLLALIVADTINAGADIGAIAAGVNLLAPVPIIILVAPIGLLILAMQIVGSYRLVTRVFKWLTLALFAYVATAFFVKPDWLAVLKGTFIPTVQLNRDFLMALVALLGTTISPYLFFWQASQEVEEQKSAGRIHLWQRRGASSKDLRYAGLDVGIGMFFSELVMYFIILTTAATLHTSGQTNIQSATEAAKALAPLAGKGAELLLALGLIGSGFLAVPILTGAGAAAAAEAWHWRQGLDERPRQAKAFYAVIIVSTIVGVLFNYVGINPITALYWTAVLNGLLAPLLLGLIMVMTNNAKVMGERTNRAGLNAIGWATTALMGLSAIALVATWIIH